ncbi:group II intron reverse transcriptase [Wolbachia endosymbiont (group A) of Agelastica alni]|uniref:group II intron reverse transcriptase n=1 Tax=Wolbachia endosymbiont (group A) of Agelastica alni TaxID=3066130 RepID=UPI00333E9CB7
MKKLKTTPTLTKIIRRWLKAGIMEGRKFKSTRCGTIQGGTISPLLACVALNGLEQYLKKELASDLFQYVKNNKNSNISQRKAQERLSVIFYADDSIIIHESKEIIQRAKILVEQWLKTIGLELNPEKTRISHTLKSVEEQKPGFDFLGFTVRQYSTNRSKRGYKLLIKPSRKSIKQHSLVIKQKLRKMRGITQEALIKNLNPIIRGWCQYYTSAVSSRVFSSLDNKMFVKLWRWSVMRHLNKGKRWIKKKYFRKHGNDNWKFMTNSGIHLIKYEDHAIKWHVKVKGIRSPYDGDWVYWGNRLNRVRGKSPRVIKLLKVQEGKCNYCQLYFKGDDIIEVHHQDRNRNNKTIKNLSLLHGHCHDDLHRRSMHDKHQIRGKPDDGKLSSPVSKSSGER